MDSIKKWFENFKAKNEESKELISQIEEHLSEQGFNEARFNTFIEEKIKSIEKKVIQEKLEPKNNEN